jgi:hypothetical protein
MDRNKMSNLYKGPSIDASYQVSVHLAEGFQRRRLKCEKITGNGRRTPSDGKSSLCLWQGELKIIERDKIDNHNIQIHDRSIKSCEVKLVLWTHVVNTSRSFPHS